MKKTTLMLALAGLAFSNTLLAHDSHGHSALSPMQKKVQQVMTMSHRTDKDTKRDANRDPVNALEFFGLKQDMKVVELLPGRGWYTKILAPVLQDKGQLILASAGKWLDGMAPLLAQKGFSKVKKAPVDLNWNGDARRIDIKSADFSVTDADMVLNIREYHNFSDEGKAIVNNAAYKALKPGGAYVIVDHSRRQMQPELSELRRREDPVKVILDVQAAGFKLDKSSDMFFRLEDGLDKEVGDPSVTGKTDRFALVFRKPM